MREKLSAKRRRRGTAQDGSSNDVYVDENYGDGDEASPEEEEEELETQLAEFTEKAIEELREKHFQHQQEIEAQKAQATIAVAVADAQLAFLDDLEPSSQAAAEPPAATSAAAQTPRARLDLTGELLETLASRIPAQIEQRTQEAFDELHANYVRACTERRRAGGRCSVAQNAFTGEDQSQVARDEQGRRG